MLALDAIINLLASMPRSSIANIQARLGPLLRLDVLGVGHGVLVVACVAER